MNENSYLLLTPTEALRIYEHIKASDSSEDLLTSSVENLIATTDVYIANALEIPGHGEAGGYEHNRHKQNYIFLNNASQLWLITHEQKYLDFVTNLLTGYADIYPTLTLNQSKDTNPPGRLFHQTLNENMWLMYASLAYACIKSELSDDQKNHIETRLFREMIIMFTETYAHDFDIVHNHGLWAVAGVGVCGLAIDDMDVANKAIYGLNGDGKTGGFLAQLEQLFSPDGYYMEGPYYHRFAIRPLLIFAEAISRKRPDLDIWNFSDSVIQRTTEALMKTTFPNGRFPALNDSSKTIGINDEGLIVAASLCARHYGLTDNLTAMAQLQNEVWLSDSSIALSAAANSPQKLLNWGSLVITDGPEGEKGGVGILRTETSNDLHMALLWYGQHGSDHTLHSALDHGHFDGLHLSWFNQDNEVLHDYGFGRWVNVEPKFGGRYIPENKSYCKQTIAHNTATVDQQSQNAGDTETAQGKWGTLRFFLKDAPYGQALSAQADGYFPGVDMTRTVITVNRVSGSPIVIDLFELVSEESHSYDLPFHYDGQITHTDFDYEHFAQLSPLGTDNGYQHLWHVGQSQFSENQPSAKISWLMDHSYYSLTTSISDASEIHFCRLGANDPDFNLRSEPALIIREQAKRHLFATVLEQHGYFNESLEQSEQARGTIQSVERIHTDELADVLRIEDSANSDLLILHWKGESPEATHSVLVNGKTYEWQGHLSVQQGQGTVKS
jgi:hypothetical protein